MSADHVDKLKISVIVPAYQAADTIKRTILSAAHQTYPPCEIIVCDDGSRDGTVGVIEALGSSINGVAVRLLTQSNRGAGAARNRALESATSEWVAFLDADDEWLPEKLERSVSEIGKSDLTLVAHSYVQVASDTSERIIDCTRRYRATTQTFSALYRYGYIATSSVVVRKSAVVSAGGFDETLATAQDFDLWLKILSQDSSQFSIFDAPLMRYALSTSGITSHTMRRLDCTLRVALRHQQSYPDLIVRLMAIHYEASTAYWRSRKYLCSVWVLILFASRLGGSLMMTKNVSSKIDGVPNWLVWMFWIWVGGIFGAYLYRFNHLIVSFYKLVLSL